jgi:Holliday junction resolvase-like predicted endonuclease
MVGVPQIADFLPKTGLRILGWEVRTKRCCLDLLVVTALDYLREVEVRRGGDRFFSAEGW